MALLLAASAVSAAVPRRAAAQETRVLIVVGLGGTEQYRERFGGWARELYAGLTGRDGIPADHVTLLTERPESLPGITAERSTRENVLGAIAAMAGEAAPDDQILVVLVGHGTARGEEGRFNLPGPDLSPEELAGALASFATQTVAVAHTGSASGGFIAPLSGPRRVVLSATRTVRERNATQFPAYFVEAVTGDGADLDKDGQVSLLEAFVFARAEVARHYDEENEILTEHAVLDDNGDGEGSQDPSATGDDGKVAAAFRLGRPTGVAASTDTDDPELARMYRERQAILARVDALRAGRDTIPPEQYDDALEALLVELALKTREIRAREGGGGS
ncbi:MAG: hypothetical protein PVJ02_02350 [Gemmatimonadota bacterium]